MHPHQEKRPPDHDQEPAPDPGVGKRFMQFLPSYRLSQVYISVFKEVII